LSKKEEILYAEIDLGKITTSKRMFDVAGHYARPDVFKFAINREANPLIQIQNGGNNFKKEGSEL